MHKCYHCCKKFTFSIYKQIFVHKLRRERFDPTHNKEFKYATVGFFSTCFHHVICSFCTLRTLEEYIHVPKLPRSRPYWSFPCPF